MQRIILAKYSCYLWLQSIEAILQLYAEFCTSYTRVGLLITFKIKCFTHQQMLSVTEMYF